MPVDLYQAAADDRDDVLWADIFAALEPRLRCALIKRLIGARFSIEENSPLSAWALREQRLAARDELIRTLREWAFPALNDRAAARKIACDLDTALVRRASAMREAEETGAPPRKFLSSFDFLGELNDCRPLAESTLRRIFSGRRTPDAPA